MELLQVYGDYGVMVNTEDCGSSDTGSIPVSHPTPRRSTDVELWGVPPEAPEQDCEGAKGAEPKKTSDNLSGFLIQNSDIPLTMHPKHET